MPGVVLPSMSRAAVSIASPYAAQSTGPESARATRSKRSSAAASLIGVKRSGKSLASPSSDMKIRLPMPKLVWLGTKSLGPEVSP